MIAVAKEPFLRTMGDVMRQANYSRIELIKKLPLFAEWSMAQIASLFRHCVKKEFGYSRLLYKQGERDENVYIVLKGEVEVVSAQQLLHQEPASQKTIGMMINNKVEKKLPRVLTKIVTGGYFGDEEGFADPVKRLSARVATSDCSLLVISKKKVNQNTSWEPHLAAIIRQSGEIKKHQVDLKIQAQDGFNLRMSKLVLADSRPEPLPASLQQPVASSTEASKLKEIVSYKRNDSSNLFQLAKQGKLPFLEAPDQSRPTSIILDSKAELDRDRIKLQTKPKVPSEKDFPVVKKTPVLKKQHTTNFEMSRLTEEMNAFNPEFISRVNHMIQERRMLFATNRHPEEHRPASKSHSDSQRGAKKDNSRSQSPQPHNGSIRVVRKDASKRHSMKVDVVDLMKKSLQKTCKTQSSKALFESTKQPLLMPEVKKVDFLIKSPSSGVFDRSATGSKRPSQVFVKQRSALNIHSLLEH